jgi:hypothetical protein
MREVVQTDPGDLVVPAAEDDVREKDAHANR